MKTATFLRATEKVASLEPYFTCIRKYTLEIVVRVGGGGGPSKRCFDLVFQPYVSTDSFEFLAGITLCYMYM